MRVALILCSAAETDAVRSHLEARFSSAGEEEEVQPPAFDFAVIGSAALARGRLREDVRRRLGVPAMVILPSAVLYRTFEEDFAAATIDDLERLPSIVRRELRLRETEKALAEREAELSLAHDLTTPGRWVWDIGANRVTVSPELIRNDAEANAGTLEEWMGRIDRRDASMVDNALRATAESGTPVDVRFRVCRPDGGTVFLHVRAKRVGGESGRPPRVIGACHDVTAEALAVLALEESEARYRGLVAQVPGVVWSADVSGRMTFVSDQVAELTGYRAEEIVQAPEAFWESAIHSDDLPRLAAESTSLLDGAAPLDVEFRFRHKQGPWVWLQTRAALVGEGEGRRVVGVTSDVSSRRDAEDALRGSEARYRTLVERAREVIVSIDRDGRVRSLNQAFEELTGLSRVEWIGRSFFDGFDPRSIPLAKEKFAAVLAGTPMPGATDYLLRTRDGGVIAMEAEGRAVEAGGEVVGMVVVAHDVTARKEAEAREEKEKRLASLGQLATSVAHEFNNVLMSIMPFAELLQRRVAGDEGVQKSVRHIMDAVRRGQQISQEILRFARPGEADLEPLAVSECMESFRRKAAAILGPRYSVAVELPPREASMLADRSLLDQVATNIILNAREAMPLGGWLRIAAHVADGRVHIALTDGGSGIAPHLLDHIFEPLFTTKPGGNGLGLSIAHQAMLQQKGTIQVRSTPGEGSIFTLSLTESAPAEVTVPPRAAVTNRRMLIVEDDPSVGEGLRALLAGEGFEVLLVERGLDSAPAVESFNPGLVLLDVNLPDISGLEVYERLRSRWPSLPVIFSTGHANARALLDVHDRRVRSIMKPYDIEELMSVINTVTS
ncbi:MAG TPA: PAS domain S-box protein [Thermoanaerobaculia bacterium]|nr:PAS domain S-box protein [Thermoanaerobaculia bacterium]